MSKMDNLRAMREARYDRAVARAGQAATPKPARARMEPSPVTPDVVIATEPEPGAELCGHRNMGGRTCTRERGHDAKSHRYS
jgi:hypothetical protein